jgi:hypothetical protein
MFNDLAPTVEDLGPSIKQWMYQGSFLMRNFLGNAADVLL